MKNMNRLVEEDLLVIAGPFGKNDTHYRGIFIFHNVGNLEEMQEILQTDSAIKAGLLDFDVFEWYGSAALPVYLPVSEKITKIKF